MTSAWAGLFSGSMSHFRQFARSTCKGQHNFEQIEHLDLVIFGQSIHFPRAFFDSEFIPKTGTDDLSPNNKLAFIIDPNAWPKYLLSL